jgi:hypothetical protein
MFGGEAGVEVGRVLQKMDATHPGINALIAEGAKTTDARISRFFAPLREMEALRSRIHGTGNLERFDYWADSIRATELRVRTWVLADRLAVRMKEANAIPDTDKKRAFVWNEVVPRRVELARSYEDLIATFVRCARSPGDVGTISSIESGMRDRVVSSQDAAITNLLGEPLPLEAAVRSAYRGAPRIFLSAKCTQTKAGEPQEIRAFVLSGPKCKGLSLYCRPLGKGGFVKVPANHLARQAYRVSLPPRSEGTLEYYLEAELAGGKKVFWPATAPDLCQTVIAWSPGSGTATLPIGTNKVAAGISSGVSDL